MNKEMDVKVIETKPPKRKAKDILNDHGASGWLIIRLQRFAVLGWVLFFLVSILFAVYILVASSRPVPVIAVDASGKVLGSFEYLSPTLRSDQELKDGAKHWLNYYYSLNSRTIFDDYTAALNMMASELSESKLKEIIAINYLQKIENSGTSSFIEYEKVTLVSRKDLFSIVELTGNIVIDNGSGLIDKPFYIRLNLESVSRSTLGRLGTFGLKINAVMEK